MANTSTIDLAKPTGTDKALISVINSNSDKIDEEAGKARGNFAGTYSTSSAYAVGAYCIYQGNLYRCTTAIGSGGEAWTAGHWTQVAVGDEITALNDHITTTVSNCTSLDVLKTALLARFNSLSDGDMASVAFYTNFTTTGIPANKTFSGVLTRYSSTAFAVQVVSGGCVIFNVGYSNGTWTFKTVDAIKTASADNTSFSSRTANINVSTKAGENIKRVLGVYAMGQEYGFVWWVTDAAETSYTIKVYCVNNSNISSANLRICYNPQ